MKSRSNSAAGIQAHLTRLQAEIALVEEQTKAARLPDSMALAYDILASRRERYKMLIRLFPGSRSFHRSPE